MTTKQVADQQNLGRAVWYRRRSARAAADLRHGHDRLEAEQLAASAGARVVVEIEVSASATSPVARRSWSALLHTLDLEHAAVLVVLSPGEIARDLLAYAHRVRDVEARGARIVHREGTPDWIARVDQLAKQVAELCDSNDSRTRRAPAQAHVANSLPGTEGGGAND